MWNEEAINVWQWLYAYKNWTKKYIKWTICDLAEKFLIKIPSASASFEDIVNYINNQRIVQEGSIWAMMFGQDKKNRFVKLKNKRVWLTWVTYDDIVEEW